MDCVLSICGCFQPSARGFHQRTKSSNCRSGSRSLSLLSSGSTVLAVRGLSRKLCRTSPAWPRWTGFGTLVLPRLVSCLQPDTVDCCSFFINLVKTAPCFPERRLLWWDASSSFSSFCFFDHLAHSPDHCVGFKASKCWWVDRSPTCVLPKSLVLSGGKLVVPIHSSDIEASISSFQ